MLILICCCLLVFCLMHSATVTCAMLLHLANYGLERVAIVMLLTPKVGSTWGKLWEVAEIHEKCHTFLMLFYICGYTVYMLLSTTQISVVPFLDIVKSFLLWMTKVYLSETCATIICSVAYFSNRVYGCRSVVEFTFILYMDSVTLS